MSVKPMRLDILAGVAALAAALLCGCRQSPAAAQAGAQSTPASPAPSAELSLGAKSNSPRANAEGQYRGFDRNEYPGDDTMAAMHKTFAFTGYWLTVPPGARVNQWEGKREVLKAQKAAVPPAALGQRDALAAIAAATADGFPAHTILFLDQEEGGRLTDVQAAYLLAWTEAVAASTFRPGVYASGQLTSDDPGTVIDTIRDIRERISKGKLHEVAMFDAQDTCPPSNGCTLGPRPIREAGEPNLAAWQYSQSPRRPSLTKSCAQTYAADGNCYAPGFPKVFLDMDVAPSSDPSHGR